MKAHLGCDKIVIFFVHVVAESILNISENTGEHKARQVVMGPTFYLNLLLGERSWRNFLQQYRPLAEQFAEAAGTHGPPTAADG